MCVISAFSMLPEAKIVLCCALSTVICSEKWPADRLQHIILFFLSDYSIL